MRLLLVRRIGRALLVVLCATLVSFMLLRLAPGDATGANVEGVGLTSAQQAARAERLGLRRPMSEELAKYAAAVAHGDMGESTSERRPVSAVLGDALPATMLLSAAAMLLATVLGIGVGTLQGWQPASRAARTAAALFTASYAIPEVVLGIVLLTALSLWGGVFPAGGIGDPLVGLTGTLAERWRDRAWHLVLPACALALSWSAALLRQQRAAVRDIAAQPFVRTAQAKGLGAIRLVAMHGVRPSLAGSVALLGTMLPALVGGTVVVESLFSWPGMGMLLVRAVTLRDAPLLAGAMILVSSIVASGSLLADLAVYALDPRARDGAGS